MAGKQLSGDGLSVNVAGMSKSQLYDIMCQMKSLIEQNQQQARQILIQNPLLTKALFQAQIMLGMVKPPQAVPNIQPQVSQNPQQMLQPAQQSNTQPAPVMPGQVGIPDSAGASQALVPPRKHQNQPSMTTSPSIAATLSFQLQSEPAHSLRPPQQPRPLNPPIPLISLSQPSQLPNLPASPSHSQPLHQLQTPGASGQLQQSLQSGGFPHLPLQPPMPPQARPSPTTTFHSQYPSKIGPKLGPQHGGGPHNFAQSTYHPGARPPAGLGGSFPQSQPSVSNLPPTQMPYQGGTLHMGTEFSHQMGNAVQVDRSSSWMPSASEHPSITGHPGQQSMVPSQIGPGNHPSRAPAISPEMEKQLLQQVMNLTPEQINLLPPEQRTQVLHLQQVLRQ